MTINLCDVSIGQKVQNDRNAFEHCARSSPNIIKESNGFHNHPTLITGYDTIRTMAYTVEKSGYSASVLYLRHFVITYRTCFYAMYKLALCRTRRVVGLSLWPFILFLLRKI